MTVLITLTIAGTDTGPFNLYSNLDGYVSPFESSVPKASLLAGYASVLVPDGTTIIRVSSQGDCSNYVDIVIGATTTTTTTASPTTTTTTAVPTTTTTTTSDVVIELCCSLTDDPEAVCFLQSATLGQTCSDYGHFDCTNPLGCPV